MECRDTGRCNFAPALEVPRARYSQEAFQKMWVPPKATASGYPRGSELRRQAAGQEAPRRLGSGRAEGGGRLRNPRRSLGGVSAESPSAEPSLGFEGGNAPV